MNNFHELSCRPLNLEIELTTRCNSHCVGCSRYSEYFYPNPYLDPRIDLEIALFEKLIEGVSEVNFVLFCGVYGDPLLHPAINEILDILRRRHKKVKISVHTNGAFHTKDFWKKIASHFQEPGSHVKFSLDGFKNAHELFRRGTRWELALENAKAFMASGGRAVWQMIEFEHNRHEVEEARTFALDLGFKRFELRRNNFPGLDKHIQNGIKEKNQELNLRQDETDMELLTQWNAGEIAQKKFDAIRCKSLEKTNIYVDAHGGVWPCCWVGGAVFRPEHQLRQWMRQKLLPSYETDFNSLKKFSLQEILSHKWFASDLVESWKKDGRDEKNPLMATCVKTCGVCLQK